MYMCLYDFNGTKFGTHDDDDLQELVYSYFGFERS